MRAFHDLLYRQDLLEVCTLSGWVSPGWRPYPGCYRRAFAFSSIFCLPHHPVLHSPETIALQWSATGLPRSHLTDVQRNL